MDDDWMPAPATFVELDRDSISEEMPHWTGSTTEWMRAHDFAGDSIVVGVAADHDGTRRIALSMPGADVFVSFSHSDWVRFVSEVNMMNARVDERQAQQ